MKIKINELLAMPIFPFANAFPWLSEDEEKELAQDLEVNGQVNPIILFNGMILDGRNRLKALQRTNLTEAEVDYFEGTEFQAVERVRTLNILRRHLTVGQRSAAAYEYLPYEEAEAKVRQEATLAKPGEKIGSNVVPNPAPPTERGGKARDLVADKFNLSGQRIQEFKKVALNAPDLAAEIKAGEISLDGAVKQLKIRSEARDTKIHALEEYADINRDFQGGRLTLDEAYSQLLARKKEEGRQRMADYNEAIELITVFSRLSEERLKEFHMKMPKLPTVAKIDEALGHIRLVETSLQATKNELNRLRIVRETEEREKE